MNIKPRITSLFMPCILGLLIAAQPLYAKQFWSDNSLSLLRGNDYEVGDLNRTVLTFEHVSGHSWGDIFLFADRLESDNKDRETYWEISPRLSIGNLMDKKLKFGIIKDVLITTTAEINDTVPFTNYLYGPAIDVEIPGFAFLQLNFYRRNNEGDGDDNWQFTPVWAIPFSLGGQQLVYDGFADWVSGNDDNTPQLNFTSQLKWDLGALWQAPKTLYIGIEYVYWNNKFGIKDSSAFKTNERNLNALIKVHF